MNKYLKDSSLYEDANDYFSISNEEILNLKYKKVSFSVQYICELIQSGDLELDPEWQRNFIWTTSQQSSFIESILLGFPIQPIYFHIGEDGRYITVDGRQRLTTLFLFFSNNMEFGEMEFLKELNYLSALDIPPSHYKKVMRYSFDCTIFEDFIAPGVVYRFFERINTRGTPLSSMEIRNCIYQGKGMTFISDLAQTDAFKISTNNGFKPKRMRDKEAILRFIGICYFNDLFENYISMSAFLDSVVLRLNKTNTEKLNEMKQEFISNLTIAKEIFNQHAFRKINDNGRRGPLNMAIFESIMCFIYKNSKNKLKKNREKILNCYFSLFNDSTFLESIGRRAYDKNMIDMRLKLLDKKLGRILND